MKTVYLISVFIHIVSAIVWIGGMTFMIMVLVPALRKNVDRKTFSALFHSVGVRFRKIGWIALLLLIITGVYNLDFRGYDLEDLWTGALFMGEFGHVLMQKLIAFSAILLISIVHDFWIGPTATRLARQDPLSQQTARYRKSAAWMGRINFMLGIIVVAMGIVLVRGF